jgi:hypothetical protein
MDANDFYTAAEVAEILGLGKAAIIHRCKNGHYPGAVKAEPSPGNPAGMWLIPKAAIDNPTMTQDVAVLTRQINPAELERAIGQAISRAVQAAVEPLYVEIAELKANMNEGQTKLLNGQEVAREQGLAQYRQTMELIQETRAERKAQQRKWWKFWG